MTEDPGIRPHRKQYIVGPQPLRLRSDWVVQRLGDGSWLSHCPDLLVLTATDIEGEHWYLLGLASQTSADRPDPGDDLAAATTATIITRYESWAGRWTLIGGSEIHLDATGQLPCHWLIDADGQTWASSSPAAIRGLAPGRPDLGHELVYERGLSWIAPPIGSISGTNRLLPSQILNIETGATRWRRLAVPAAQNDQAMARFMHAIATGVARLPSDEPKQLALTAGADSRLILAAIVAAEIDIDLFTRRSARMSVADRQIPPRLAAAVGLTHREVLPRPADPDRLALAMTHTDGHVSVGDALPFVQRVRDGFTGIEIGGQGLGAGKVKHRHFPEEIGDPAETAELLADHFGEPQQSPNRQALRRWLELVVEHEQSQPPQDRVDWRDRIYLEQRTCGWQGAKEQLYDLHRHHRFFPINSARVLGLLLAVDQDLRRSGDHRRALIELAEPRLLAEPFNPPGRWFGLRRRVAHLLLVDRWGIPARVAKKLWSPVSSKR
ncbi:MAG: hypothetical protein ACRBK7_12375 [Acidimicrobiales bacterium]